MTKIIHAADLHLKESEKDYCFGVLDEIIALALKESAAYLLFCGDLFDSFEDMKALKNTFRLKLEGLKGCEVLYLPGNHEDLRRGPEESLETHALGPLTKCFAKPYNLLERETVEFLCVPHQESYAGYRDWGVPSKVSGKPRIVLFHGTDSSVYTGPETEETKSGIIDEDMFRALEADYVAMGHIHTRTERRNGQCLACYSGSASVWRTGELGPRGVFLLEVVGGAIKLLGFQELQSAGQYRFVSLPLSMAGTVEAEELKAVVGTCGKVDLIEIEVSGVVENENLVAAAETEIRGAFAGCRPVKVSRGEIVVAAGLAAQPAARQFLEKWRAKKPEDPMAEKAWLLARVIGLKAIAGALK